MEMETDGLQWFAAQAVRLLDARNVRETDNFYDLIDGYQQLLQRGHSSLHASTTNLSASTTFGMKSSSSSSAPLDPSTDASLKYLNTIQQLEHELNTKNAQLASYAGSHLQLVAESKELLAERSQWHHQLDFFTQRLEEEMLLNEEKDRSISELNDALTLLRDELARHKTLLEKSESENETLHTRIRQLEAQLVRKTLEMATWLAEHEAPQELIANATGSMASQEMAEAVSQLYVTSNSPATSKIVTQVGHTIRAHATEVNSVCFNASGKVLFSGSSDGTVRAWDAATCRALGEYRGVGTAHPLLCVRVSDDGARVLGTGSDRKCFVWRVGTGRVFQTLTGHKGKVVAAEFSTVTQSHVVTGSADRSLRVWDVARGLSLQSINCRSSCNDVAMALGGEFASAHHDGAVRFWDARTNQLAHECKDVHQDQVTSVSFARDGHYVLTNSRDNTLQVVDTRTFATVVTLTHPQYHVGFDWSKASLSPDGVYAAAGSASGTVFLWNVRTGKVEEELKTGHQGAVASCVWRPDGQGLASCDKNGCLVLWE